MKQITIDIETASDENIKDCGVYRYAESECFDLLLVSYAVDNGPVATCDIANGETLPDDVRNALTDKTVIKKAFHVNFERICLSVYLRRKYPEMLDFEDSTGSYLDPVSWQCDMIHCRYLGMLSSLDDMGRLLRLKEKKMAELACGCGGSIGAIKAMGGTELKLSDDDLFKLVDDWRNSSPNIVKFWGDVQRAAEKVIIDQCGMTCGKLRFSYESGIFFIELPSRRRLAYVRPKVEKDDNGKNIITYEGIDNSHKWNRLKTYGAKLVENITQGVARDLLLYAMQNMQDMEIVGHVHDEVIIECTPDVSVEQVCELMGQTPKWAEGLLLRADGYECAFYMKQ